MADSANYLNDPRQLVHLVERAMIARQRYVRSDGSDQSIDQQLLNHVMLLQDLARRAGATDAELHAAVERADILVGWL